MRVASGRTDAKLVFVAVDSVDLVTRETGLTGFTVYRSRNGGTATAYTTPTVAELSSSNMPGVYVLTLDEDTTITSGVDEEECVVHITQASMAPVTRTYQLFRPKVTEGSTLASATVATSTAVSDIQADVDALTSAVASVQSDTNDIQSRIPSALISGRLDVTVGAMQNDVVTAAAVATGAIDAAAVASDAGNKIADHVWRRNFTNVAASSNGDTEAFRSGLGAARKLTNKVAISGLTLTVYKEDDSTSAGTQAVATDAAANPIVSLDTA